MAGKDAISKTREEFNKHRKLLLLNIPPSTEGEVREFLGSFKASKIAINDSLDSALVTLTNPGQLDEAVEKLNNKQFKDNIVKAKQGLGSHLVCVAHIPLLYTDFKFRDFCKKFGPVEYCYIMRTATGLSKGYGFVEFNADAEGVSRIRSDIDWQLLEGYTLHADFLDKFSQTWEGLQSRCLFLHNMPEDFVDVSKLREIIGVVTNPLYCQIIVKDKKSLGFGIVEFRTAEEAENAWMKLKNEKIYGKDVVMTFCIPGKSAVYLNNRVIDKYSDKQNLDGHMPVIAGNAIAISLTKQIPRLMVDLMKVLQELQQVYISENRHGSSNAGSTLPLSPMINPNLQLGLMVMMAIHIQAVKGGEQFNGVLAKQLNSLMMLSKNETSAQKIPLLSDQLIGQANVILLNLKQQLNQTPVMGDNGKPLMESNSLDEKIRYTVKKFIVNAKHMNLTLLSALGQIFVNMKQLDTPSYGLGPKTPSILGPLPVPNPLLGSGSTQLGKTSSSLPVNPSPVVTPQASQNPTIDAKINSTILQAMGLNVGSGSNLGNVGQSLLNQISQGLMTQISQNLMKQITAGTSSGKAGSNASKQKSKSSSAAQSSLPGALSQNANQALGTKAVGTFNQTAWKNDDSRWGTGVYDVKAEVGTNYDISKGAMGVMGAMGTDSYGTFGGKVEAGADYNSKGAQAAGYSNLGYGSNEFGRYTFDGQTDYYYQNNNNYTNQYGATYGVTGTAGNSAGYGVSSGFENTQAPAGNYQDDQVYKAGNSGVGQGGERYGAGGYGGGMSAGMGYGYDGRDGQQDGYSSYGTAEGYSTGTVQGGGMSRDGAGGSDLTGGGVGQQWGGGMGSGGMGGGQFGVGGMGGGEMSSGGMGGGGMGGGDMGAGQFGGGGLGSGGMGSGDMGTGQFGGGGMGGGQFGGGGMGGGHMGVGGMGNRGEHTSGGMLATGGYVGSSSRGMNDGYFDSDGRNVNERYMGSGGGFGTGGRMGGSLSESVGGSMGGNLQGGYGMSRGMNDGTGGSMVGMGNSGREDVGSLHGSRFTGGMVSDLGGPAPGLDNRGSSSYFTTDEANSATAGYQSSSRFVAMPNLKRGLSQMAEPGTDNSSYGNQYSEGHGYVDNYKRNRLY